MTNLLSVAWALGLASCVVGIVEQVRGTESAPREVKLTLRQLWRGLPTPAYVRFAYHDAPNPTRARLRRSAWAQTIFLCCWTFGASAAGAPWWFAIVGVGFAALLAWALLQRPQPR